MKKKTNKKGYKILPRNEKGVVPVDRNVRVRDL